MSSITNIHCPLCSHEDPAALFKKELIPYYRCRSCGFVFSKNDSNPNLSNKLEDFETAYLQYFESNPADNKNYKRLVAWMEKHISIRKSSLLDIGCGSGKFVKWLDGRSIKAFGIEPSSPLYSEFLQDKRLFAQAGPQEFAQQHPGTRFDIITLFDVLEHISGPLSFLNSIAVLMNEDARLFISTPDAGSLHRRMTGKNWHYFNKYHFSFFTGKTIRYAARRSGLEVICVKHLGRYFQPAYLWNYFRNFIMGRKTKNPVANKGISIPINLHDNMYIVLKKAGKKSI